MNNFRFLVFIFVISFSATTQANQIDLFAQGLEDIVKNAPLSLEDLYQKILDDYKNEKFDEVKELLKNAPQELFGENPKKGNTLLIKVINEYIHPFTDSVYYNSSLCDIECQKSMNQKVKKREEIIGMIIEKSTNEQLSLY